MAGGPKRDPSKPYSRYREPGQRGVLVLPGSCDLPVPALPGGRSWSTDERGLWAELWTAPQASQWDDSFIPSVAAYVCHFTAVLSGDAPAWAAQEMRHLGEQLGLTPRGLLALGWALPTPGAGDE